MSADYEGREVSEEYMAKALGFADVAAFRQWKEAKMTKPPMADSIAIGGSCAICGEQYGNHAEFCDYHESKKARSAVSMTDEEIQAFLKELADELTQFLPEKGPEPVLVALAIWPTICRLMESRKE